MLETSQLLGSKGDNEYVDPLFFRHFTAFLKWIVHVLQMHCAQSTPFTHLYLILAENIFLNKMCACKNKPMCENRVPKQRTAHSGAGCQMFRCDVCHHTQGH